MSTSSSHATVTYTSISTDNDLPPWSFHLVDVDEPKAPPLPVPTPAYPKYLTSSDDEDGGGKGEGTEMDPINYADDDYEEEEEHLAPADSALPVSDSIPSSEETKPFETDESVATPPPPRSPQTIIPLSHTRLCRARISVRPHTPPSPSTKARIAEYASAPTPPSPPPSPLTQLSFPLLRIPSPPLLLPPTRPLHTSPTYDQIPSPPLPLPSPDRKDSIPEVDMLPQKRTCFTASSHRFKIVESLAVAAAMQNGSALARGVDYGFIDTLDATIEAQIKALHAKVRVLQRQRIDNGDKLTSQIQHEHDIFRELEHTRDAWLQDGPTDTGNSC
ncbi:hypothetical protein Tco_0802958 [Tanacetum coccineum]|uniref:Uncharacterized protein n=1 Tax=Tanacetum coccineum TaxID=301880 RepID=A0ABQ5A154_9ASTR